MLPQVRDTNNAKSEICMQLAPSGMRCLVIVNITSNISEELPYLVQCHMNN